MTSLLLAPPAFVETERGQLDIESHWAIAAAEQRP